MKRFVDVFGALVLLLVLFPVMVCVSILIVLFFGWPILFVQARPGLNGKAFKMIKFRTMLNIFDANGDPLPDDRRLSKLGKFLRATSMDELPELWNVLKGEMSLIGPRPLLMEYLPLYSKMQFRRHEVRPGVTGWAQVNGRNALSWDERFRLDVWYVENKSFFLDVKILFLTVIKILKRGDVEHPVSEELARFRGGKT